MTDAELNNIFIVYLVEKGYDHDDLVTLGLGKSVMLILRLLSEHSDEITLSPLFVVHIESFVKANFKNFSMLQLKRL